MIELPESHNFAKQIKETLKDKTVNNVIAASSPHKFAWYYDDPVAYADRLVNTAIETAHGMGMFVEVTLSRAKLLFSDGVALRWHPKAGQIPKKHQLLLEFDDGTYLTAAIQMYGGVFCWGNEDTFENPYYKIAQEKPSPLTDAFDEDYFDRLLFPEEVQKLPLKAALATEQRIPGLGNGCLQDILWHAKLHPRRRTNTLSSYERNQLFSSLKQTLMEMTALSGRNTEKDLFGEPGGYQVVMSSPNKNKPCPRCGALIEKASYLGGSIYICPACQPVA